MSSEFTKEYLNILALHFSGLNLTRILEESEFELKQFKDSILPLEVSSIFRKDLEGSNAILDLGFGGGFPLLPLASTLQLKDKLFLGLDSKNKKVEAVKKIAKLMGLKKVIPIHGRYEDFTMDINKLVVVTKAMAKIETVINNLNLSKPLTIYFYKGPNVETEEKIHFSLAGVKQIEYLFYELPNGDKRSLLGYEIVPRGTREKKSSVLLSSIM